MLAMPIYSKLSSELNSTVKEILKNPSCGKTVKDVQYKYIQIATEYYSKTHPKLVAKRLAKNNVTESIKDLMENIQK